MFERLEATRFSNSNWWACERRRFYAPLARWYIHALAQGEPGELSKQRLTRLGTCYYHIGLFKQWEDCRKLCGQITPRQIEKGLHAADTDNTGKGRQSVLRRMADATQKPEDVLSVEDAFSLLNDASPKARLRGINRFCTSADPRATGAALLVLLSERDQIVAKCAADVLELRKLLAPIDERKKINGALEEHRRGIFEGRLKAVLFPKTGPATDEF